MQALRSPLSHATCRRAVIDRSQCAVRFQLALFWSTTFLIGSLQIAPAVKH